jgi:hypothetical protein
MHITNYLRRYLVDYRDHLNFGVFTISNNENAQMNFNKYNNEGKRTMMYVNNARFLEDMS